MKFINSDLKEVILIKPEVIEDDRGFFFESYKKSEFEKQGISDIFIQDNHSKSVLGVLRGLHYQLEPYGQSKIVRCIKGSIFDVAVDIRKNSPTFGKWVGYELSEINKHILYIPNGFAHGFLTLSKEAEVLYKTNKEYNPKFDRGILWNDKRIGIIWPPVIVNPILSSKDQKLPILNDAEINFLME